MIPVPQFVVVQFEAAANGDTDAMRSDRNCAALIFGASASTSEAVPETMGAAALVPSANASASETGTVAPVFERTAIALTPAGSSLPPGADSAMPLPKLL